MPLKRLVQCILFSVVTRKLASTCRRYSFLISFFSNTKLTDKTVGFSGIQTRIIRIWGKNADNLTNTTAQKFTFFKWTFLWPLFLYFPIKLANSWPLYSLFSIYLTLYKICPWPNRLRFLLSPNNCPIFFGIFFSVKWQ